MPELRIKMPFNSPCLHTPACVKMYMLINMRSKGKIVSITQHRDGRNMCFDSDPWMTSPPSFCWWAWKIGFRVSGGLPIHFPRYEKDLYVYSCRSSLFNWNVGFTNNDNMDIYNIHDIHVQTLKSVHPRPSCFSKLLPTSLWQFVLRYFRPAS